MSQPFLIPHMEALESIDQTAEVIKQDLDAAARYTADVRQKVHGATGTIWEPTLYPETRY